VGPENSAKRRNASTKFQKTSESKKAENKVYFKGEAARFELFPSRRRLGGLVQAAAPSQPQKRGAHALPSFV